MRLNRTRAAVISVVSATAIVGLPLTLAAPAGAQPLGISDDGDPSAVELPLFPAADGGLPPSADALADPVPQVVSPAADTVTEEVLPAGVADFTADEVQSAPETSTPDPAAPASPSDGTGDSSSTGDTSSTDDTNSPAAPDSTDQSSNSGADTTTDSAGVESAAKSAESSTDTAADTSDKSAEEGSVAGASATRSEAFVATGANNTSDVLRTGLALLFGGAVLVGAGRHRRPGRTRFLI